jgi:hemerythrin-like domain-containing protein
MMADRGRRDFLRGVGIAAAGIAAGRGFVGGQEQNGPAPVSAAERLMSEHGVIQRLMICFDEAADNMETGVAVPMSAVLGAGAIADEFVGSYHEELEEQFIFKALEDRREQSALILTLRRQHAAGRALTGRIMNVAGGGLPRGEGRRRPLAVFCRSYARMYRAHAAHEDTVLMPALRALLGADAFAALGGQVTEFARQTLGMAGLADALGRVAAVEEELGIATLADFTAEP